MSPFLQITEAIGTEVRESSSLIQTMVNDNFTCTLQAPNNFLE